MLPWERLGLSSELVVASSEVKQNSTTACPSVRISHSWAVLSLKKKTLVIKKERKNKSSPHHLFPSFVHPCGGGPEPGT